MSRVALTATAAVLAVLPFCGSASAQDIKLPKQLSWTAYDTGSSGFNIAVAIGQQAKKHGTDVRVLAASNDTARLAPLRSGRTAASAMGTGVFYAQEGVYEFGTREWGPQPIRLMMSSISCNGATLGIAKDTGFKEVKDLKGKRVAVVVGSPALTQNAMAILAFGGLTAKDVKIVEFSGYGAMWKGIVNNEADAGFASTISAQPKEVETSPRGLVWAPTPAADKAGWDRIMKMAPYYQPHQATCGAGLSKDKPLDGATFAYPIFSAYASTPEDQVYAMTKLMIVEYPNYKDAAPGADGFDVKKQSLEWAIPYHPGAVKALKEAGVWTDKAEKHNQALLKRQELLATTWKAYNDTKPADDKFLPGWMAARNAALKKANLDVVFE
ncbi:TAXI family TRAP transporter solute-binding subunit [Desertibaculum subflavum]|uniref:TAXI family TRAP transporter solute-binding subunit n=1 Tax=Desertibaculum subflavum TaxID=2268458 RepID=UPI000E664979